MKLKKVSPLIAGKVTLYEEAERENEYDDIFTGDKMDIPGEMLEREIVVIGVNHGGLDIELKKK